MTLSAQNWQGWQDWTVSERIVFSATVGLKASYGGDRDYRLNEAHRATGITRDEWDTAKAALILRGVFNRAGAVKPDWKRAFYAESGSVPCVSQGHKRGFFEN